MHDSERFDRQARKTVNKIPSTLKKIIAETNKKRAIEGLPELTVYAINKQAYLSDRTLGGILAGRASPQIKVLTKILTVLNYKLSDFFKLIED